MRLFKEGEYLGEITLEVIGEFNLSNAAMACAAAMECGIGFDVCQGALSSFLGIPTRLELVGEWKGRRVYFDYAHHPTEIEEGIKAIKSDTGRALTVIFGPHTFSRTKVLFDGFARVLSLADKLLITDIDAVREKMDDSISSELLAEKTNGRVIRTEDELVAAISASDGDIAVMGAADLGWVKNLLSKENY